MKLFPPTTLRHVSHLLLKPKKPDSAYAFFQQDGATAHTSQFSMSYVHEAFRKECKVSTGLWPPRSPDLSF